MLRTEYIFVLVAQTRGLAAPAGVLPIPNLHFSMPHTPWYHEGLRFECTACGACCTGAPGHVWVNQAEIEALAALLKVDLETFERQYVRQVGIRRSLIERPGGDCVLYDAKSRGCRAYEARPRQCRTWPFWASNLRTADSWAKMAEGCPGANRGPLHALDEILAAAVVMRV